MALIMRIGYRWRLGGLMEISAKTVATINGNTLDHDGGLITCELVTRRVSRMLADGRVVTLVDRYNNRIQVFDQDGGYLFEWKQFGRPSGLFIDSNDFLYVADSQSGERYNASFEQGIRVGSVKDGEVTAFIPRSGDAVGMAESLAVDKQGNIYGGFIEAQTLRKYQRQKP